MPTSGTPAIRSPRLFAVRCGMTLCLCAAALGAAAQPAAGPWQQHPMSAEVEALIPPSAVTLDPPLIALWQRALERPEPGTRLEAAEAFAAIAQQGVPGLADAVGDDLIDHYRGEGDALVRRALARALVTLDAREAASLGWAAEDDEALHLLTDAALARWGVADAATAWLERLSNTNKSEADRASAAHALGVVADARFPDAALAVLQDAEASWALRYAVAEAVARQPDARIAALAEEWPTHAAEDRLLAAVLRGAAPRDGSSNAPAVAALRGLLDDADAAVALAALRSLGRVALDAARESSVALVEHADAAVRLAAIQTLATGGPTEPTLALLADRLDDVAVTVRTAARRLLLELHARQSIEPVVTQALAGEGWRGLEQALMLAGELGFTNTAGQAASLLKHDRAEVRVAAATTLRRLAVPDTLEAMLTHATTLAQPSVTEQDALDAEVLTQLVLAMGEMDHAPADALLRELVAKVPPRAGDVRVAAAWSLGRVHTGSGDASLIAILAARVNDRTEMDPEDPLVKGAAVLAIARIGGTGQADALRRWALDATLEPEPRYAAHHAYAGLSTDPLPPMPAPLRGRDAWFLTPLE